MKYIEYDIAERYLHEACRYIGSNGGLMIKCEFNEEPTIEIVRCKDCDNRQTDDCPMYHEEWYEIDEGDGYVDNDFTVHDYSTDDGFCSWAEMKGGAE